MADPSTLLTTSVPNPDAGAQVTALQTEAVAEALSGKVATTGVNPAIGAILSQLESGASVDQNSVLAQLAGLSQPISVFLQQLQSAVTTAKEGTTQGLLLSQELNQGVITTEQFQTAISAIQLTQAQLTSLVSNNVNASVAQLLTTLASESQINSLPPLLSAASAAQPDPTKAPSLKLDTTDPNGIMPDAAPQLQSDKNQEILSWFANLFKTAADIAKANIEASLSSFASLRAQPKIMSGARAVVRINGKVSALCTGVSYEISSDWAEIKGVDELIPNDLAPLAYSIKGSMSIYRIPNGSPIGQFLTSDMFSSIIWPYTTIEIRDKRTDELIVLLKRVMITSQSESFRKGELTATNLTFIGIEFRDEMIPQLLPPTLTGDASGTQGLIGAVTDIANKIGDAFS